MKDDTKLLDSNDEGGSLAFPVPLTKTYRVCHSAVYVFGGTLFMIGSVCYAPSVSNYDLGGWTFTWGSAAFLVADLTEYVLMLG